MRFREANRGGVAPIIRLAAERSHAGRDAWGAAARATSCYVRADNELRRLAVRTSMRASLPLSGNGVLRQIVIQSASNDS